MSEQYREPRVLTKEIIEQMPFEQRQLIADVLTTLRFHSMNHFLKVNGHPGFDSPEVELEILTPFQIEGYYECKGHAHVEGEDEPVLLSNTIHYQDSASGCLLSLSGLLEDFVIWAYENDREV